MAITAPGGLVMRFRDNNIVSIHLHYDQLEVRLHGIAAHTTHTALMTVAARWVPGSPPTRTSGAGLPCP